MTTAAEILSQFKATGVQTCFHDRHINPQIYAGLNGSNWSIKDYEARGGYQALRRILGKDGGEGLTQDQVIATVKESLACVVVGAQAFLRGSSGASCRALSLVRSIWFATRTRVSLELAKTAIFCNSIRTS